MFSQKKKRSKGLLFLIPVLLVFLAGLALNAFMSGGSDGEDDGGDGDANDRLVNAGYDPDSDAHETDDDDGDADEYAGASADISEKGSNISAGREYTDNAGANSFNGSSGRYDEGMDAADDTGDTDEYYYGSDPYSEIYGEDGGYSGYRAVSENDTLVIYKYSDGAVVSEKRTDIQTDILPEYDREMLENGIDMSSESDVDELLQDYEG